MKNYVYDELIECNRLEAIGLSLISPAVATLITSSEIMYLDYAINNDMNSLTGPALLAIGGAFSLLSIYHLYKSKQAKEKLENVKTEETIEIVKEEHKETFKRHRAFKSAIFGFSFFAILNTATTSANHIISAQKTQNKDLYSNHTYETETKERDYVTIDSAEYETYYEEPQATLVYSK